MNVLPSFKSSYNQSTQQGSQPSSVAQGSMTTSPIKTKTTTSPDQKDIGESAKVTFISTEDANEKSRKAAEYVRLQKDLTEAQKQQALNTERLAQLKMKTDDVLLQKEAATQKHLEAQAKYESSRQDLQEFKAANEASIEKYKNYMNSWGVIINALLEKGLSPQKIKDHPKFKEKLDKVTDDQMKIEILKLVDALGTTFTAKKQ